MIDASERKLLMAVIEARFETSRFETSRSETCQGNITVEPYFKAIYRSYR